MEASTATSEQIAPELLSEGLGEIGDHVRDKGKVKSLRINGHGDRSMPSPGEDASPHERATWEILNSVESVTEVRVELERGTVFRWLAEPDLEPLDIALRVEMIALVREAFLSNRSVTLFAVVDEVKPKRSPGVETEMTINRIRSVEVTGANI